MSVFNTAPTYETPLTTGGKTHTVWYRFFQNSYKGVPPSSESILALEASPFAYQAPAKGFLIVRGGSVSAIQFTRVTTTLTGQTQGVFPLSQGDTLTITYTGGGPTLTWVPQ
jgi:hypothetical protein